MPSLNAKIESRQRESLPGDFHVRVVLTNPGPEPVSLNPLQVASPSLVLEVRDARDRPVLLPPPSTPTEQELEASRSLAPTESLALDYGGFLDRSQAAGGYRVRYCGAAPELGGSPEAPLTSEWLEFQLLPASADLPTGPPLQVAALEELSGFAGLIHWIRRLLHALACFFRRLFGRKCDRRLSREVDEARTETISGAPANVNRNGTYGWRSRFRVTVDEKRCTVTVLVRIRLVGAATAAQRTAIETAIENRWNGKFKLCCVCCCCRNGYDIVTDVEFVANGEHQVVNLGAQTTSMTDWAANNTFDIPHEFGHMLGALDEYYTVNGTNFGPPNAAAGSIMNNSARDPEARHYDLIRDAVRALLNTRCTTVARNAAC